MRRVFLTIAATTVYFSTCLSPAGADDNKEVCLFYGNVGAAAVDFILPLKVQQVVDMISGKDTTLVEKMQKSVEGIGNDAAKTAMKKMGEDAAEHLGSSAGFLAFQLIMTGQATSPQEVFSVLYKSCLDTGAQKIVENQRAAAQPEPQ